MSTPLSEPLSPEKGNPAPPPDAPLPTLGHIDSYWAPPEGGTVTAHSGKPLPADLVYLGKPPEEIGAVRTAFSTIRKDSGPDRGWPRRIGFGVAIAALLVLFSAGGCAPLGVPKENILFMGFWAVAALVGSYFAFGPRNSTTYVGEQGVSEYLYKGKSQYPTASFMQFSAVTDLTVGFTDHYTRGIYTHTDYAYNFTKMEDAGKPGAKFAITGSFRRSGSAPPKNEHYHYGISAERAYSTYRLPLCRALLEEGKSVAFRVVGQGALLVSAEGLKLAFKKEEIIPKEEIGGLNIAQGTVTITRKGATKGILGIGASGVYSFSYSSLSNARLFFALLSEVIGQTKPQETIDIANSR